MKKLYLCLSFALVLICQCLFAAPGISAADDSISQEAELLAAIGLLKGDENGDFRLDDTITRAEYTALILRMLGHESLSNQMGTQTGFDDVGENHWASGYIRLANELKLISGTGNNCFEPDRSVNLQEAVKMMVCALGYGPMAEKDGGYYAGYSKWALRLKLLKGVSDSGEFTRRDACSLIENALTVNMVNALGEVVSGENVLTSCLNLTAMKGVVTGTNNIGEQDLDEGFIEISGKVYKTRHLFDEELFACEVEFYVYERNAGEEEIYYIHVKENENRLNISYKEILDTTSLSEFKYRKGGREQTEKLADSLIIYYNGEKVNSKNISEALLKPDLGNVILCDAEKDGIYDIAIVTSYRTMVVNYYGHDTVYDVYGKHLLVNPDDIDIFYRNEKIKIEDLEKGDVISVAESISGEKIKIYKSNDVYSGYICEKGINENEDTYYGFENESGEVMELVVAKSYQEALDANLVTNVLTLGKQRTYVALNFFGEISDAWTDEMSDPTALHYGYLIAASADEPFQNVLAIKVLTANNRFEIFEIAKNDSITFGRMVNGTYRQTKEGTGVVYQTLGGNDTNRQVIRYRLNEEGKLTQLYLADTEKTPNTLSEDVPKFFATYRQGVLDQKYYIDSSTVVFSMPRDDVYEDVMAAGKYQSFFSEGQSRYCTLYDADNGAVGAVVIHEAPAIRYDSPDEGFEKILSYASSPVLFINGSRFAKAEDDEFYMNINGFQEGKKVTVTVSDNLSRDSENSGKLTAGTVIQYETNSYIKLNAMDADKPEQMIIFEKIFDFNNNDTSGVLWNHDIIVEKAPEILTIWGRLSAVDAAYCSIEVQNGDKTESYVMAILNNSTFMKYDSDKKEFIPINMQEIVPGQRVYICKRGNKQDIVVY